MSYHWQLRYADGRVADEPENTTSILICPAGAMAIAVCAGPIGNRVPVVVEYMEHERLPKHGPWVPIFYRKVSMNADGGEHNTDLVVFGRGCEGPNEVSAKLWAMRGGKPVDCPSWAIDVGVCQSMVMESLSGVTR